MSDPSAPRLALIPGPPSGPLSGPTSTPPGAAPEPKGRGPGFPLGIKLALMATVLVVVPLLGVGLALIDINVRAIKDSIREFQVAVADDIGRTLGERLTDARAGLDAVRDALVDPALSDDTRLALVRALVTARPELDAVGVHDRSGAVIDTLQREGSPPVPVPALGDAAEGLTVIFEGTGRLRVVRPLTVNGGVTGLVSGWVDLAPIAQRIERLAGAHFPDQPEPLRLVDAAGRVLAGGPVGGTVESPARAGLAAAAAGVAPSLEYSIDDVPVTGAVVAVPGTPFAVVVRQPQAVVYGRLETMRLIVMATIAAAILLAVLVALLMARRITRPVRALAQFAEDLSARRFGGVVEVDTRDELAVLGRAMTTASRRLQESEVKLLNEAAIRTDLGRYLPREIVERVVAREQDMRLGGARTQVSVLFADVVGFTPLAESQSPEVVVTVLNELFTILTDIVFQHGGTIDKFIGDCVMAVWGAPEPQADHAARALTAAEDMMRWVEAAGAGWLARFGIELQLAIGINSGEAVVGNVGSESRMEYTAIGDVVNVAARLEAIARPNQILVTSDTRAAAGEGFEFAAVGRRPVTGRREPVQLFEVVA